MIASPCINICRMDPASALRNLTEIAAWSATDRATPRTR
ncbi:MAG: DUF1289 domain-containing protein [Azonexus sp.]|jgi:predicted Fe-S protein YdhL (DUF1289 family)|nr:DUF1289 domain-containing protein [Azonexus sp.]